MESKTNSPPSFCSCEVLHLIVIRNSIIFPVNKSNAPLKEKDEILVEKRVYFFVLFFMKNIHLHKNYRSWLKTQKSALGSRGTYIERNISLSAIDKPTSEAGVPSHYSMNTALSKESAIHIISCIAWNSTDHVCRICPQQNR